MPQVVAESYVLQLASAVPVIGSQVPIRVASALGLAQLAPVHWAHIRALVYAVQSAMAVVINTH